MKWTAEQEEAFRQGYFDYHAGKPCPNPLRTDSETMRAYRGGYNRADLDTKRAVIDDIDRPSVSQN